ncbi:actin-like protein ARP6 [Phellopilus nigrolimitatus]|nr:actin-like protein ARP6 [Phellopilus nigrolimitatus]
MQGSPVIVLDNGASTIKTNVVTSLEDIPEPRIVANAIVRQTKGEKQTFFGHEFDQCRDFASLHFRLPFERGYLTDWDAQKAIWDGLFSNSGLNVNTAESSLLITEPYFNLPNIQERYDQFVFEEYDFESCYRCTPASLMPYGSLFRTEETNNPPPECMLIVDSGFSFTHIVPLVNGQVTWKSVRRVDVGGKLLTNHLKELLSYRQFDLMGETFIPNDVKERCCYVSTDYKHDMELCRAEPSKMVQEYVLPKFTENRPGRVKASDEMVEADDDVLRMTSERFAVPEVLFRPSDIGLAQSGVSRAIADAICSLPEDLQGLFWSNIGLVGGNIKFSGFRERLMAELRSLVPTDHEVCIYESSNAISEAYFSGAEFVRQPDFVNQAVSREEYQEYGSNVCRRKFANVSWQARGEEGGEGRDTITVEKEKLRSKGRARAKVDTPEPTHGRRPTKGSRTRAMTNK